jgi:formamidopyrimidine-DNA glycosylase
MLFRFSKGGWLGIHLGMTGRLSTSDRSFAPGKHDHLVLVQHDRALVFSDPRLFGRVRFSCGPVEPDWWVNLPASIDSPEFDRERMETFLRRHAKLPIKGALLLQDGFPGIGNWMADEILWRARIHPRLPAGGAAQAHSKALFREVQAVSRGALKHVSPAFSDPPAGWLFHQRWSKTGRCPRDGQPLERATVGGRTTAWCPVCQAV